MERKYPALSLARNNKDLKHNINTESPLGTKPPNKKTSGDRYMSTVIIQSR